jgi:hypothetical protein
MANKARKNFSLTADLIDQSGLATYLLEIIFDFYQKSHGARWTN